MLPSPIPSMRSSLSPISPSPCWHHLHPLHPGHHLPSITSRPSLPVTFCPLGLWLTATTTAVRFNVTFQHDVTAFLPFHAARLMRRRAACPFVAPIRALWLSPTVFGSSACACASAHTCVCACPCPCMEHRTGVSFILACGWWMLYILLMACNANARDGSIHE